jgi:hypothetical protein
MRIENPPRSKKRSSPILRSGRSSAALSLGASPRPLIVMTPLTWPPTPFSSSSGSSPSGTSVSFAWNPPVHGGRPGAGAPPSTTASGTLTSAVTVAISRAPLEMWASSVARSLS